jgi:hypothetical protein
MENDDDIIGWLGVKDPIKIQYQCDILLPARVADEIFTSVFDFLPMAPPLSFNHGLQ